MDDTIYMLLTGTDINQGTSFCSSYCGWHTYYTQADGVKVKFLWTGEGLETQSWQLACATVVCTA
jgi:hypothetical protein